MLIPLMFSEFLTADDKTSPTKIYKYGERGSPCRTPLDKVKYSEVVLH